MTLLALSRSRWPVGASLAVVGALGVIALVVRLVGRSTRQRYRWGSLASVGGHFRDGYRLDVYAKC